MICWAVMLLIFSFPKIRDELGADDVPFGRPGVFLDAGLHIGGVLLKSSQRSYRGRHLPCGAVHAPTPAPLFWF